MFPLIVINLVLIAMVQSSHELWNKPLNDDEVKQVTLVNLIPLIVSLGAIALAFLLYAVAYNRSPQANAVVTIVIFLAAVIPIISVVISIGGTLWVYMGADGSTKRTNKPATALSLRDAAKFLDITEEELLTLVKSGHIQARKVNGQYRFEPEILSVWRSMQS